MRLCVSSAGNEESESEGESTRRAAARASDMMMRFAGWARAEGKERNDVVASITICFSRVVTLMCAQCQSRDV